MAVDWDKLYGKIGSHPGSWSVLGIPLPDFGKTEEYQKAVFPNTAVSGDERGSNLLGSGALTPVKENDIRNISGTEREWAALNNKGQMMNTGTGEIGRDTARILAQLSSGVNTDTGTKDKTNTSGTSGTVKVGTDETEEEKKKREREATIRAQQAIAKSKYDEGLRRAAEYLNSAQTYTNKMKGIIGDKRGEFEKMFDEARGQIGTSAGQRIGEAGRSSQELATSLGNRARALGLTGTTAQSMLNRPQDALARDIFNINQQRTSNENENRRLLNERQDWATGQEAELDQYLQNVANEAQSMRNTSYLDYWENLSNLDQKLDNYIGNMINAQNQAALMAPTIQGYDTSAYSPEFANTMNSLQGLKSGINSMYLNQTPSGGDDAATLVSEDEVQKLLKRFT